MASTGVGFRNTRVVLIESSAVLRVALREYLGHYARETTEVVGEASGGWKALREVAFKRPDIVLVDLHLPDRMALDCARRIHLFIPKASIILAVWEPSGELIETLKEQGICTIVDKSRLVTSLLGAIWKCSQGRC